MSIVKQKRKEKGEKEKIKIKEKRTKHIGQKKRQEPETKKGG